MEQSIHRISLEIQSSHAGVALDMKRGDTGRRIFITLTDGGKPYHIGEDCYAVFTARRPDGDPIFNPCTVEGNTVIYDVTPKTTSAAGKLDCEIKLYGRDDCLITSAAFTINVHRAVYNDEDEPAPEAEVDALTHLISQANTLVTDVQQKLNDGEFRGEKGDKGDPGAQGEKGDPGKDGQDYVLTDADKEEIAGLVDTVELPPYGCEIGTDIANYSDSELFAVRVKPETLGGSDSEASFGTEEWGGMSAISTTESAYVLNRIGATTGGRLRSITLQCGGVGNAVIAIAHVTDGVVTGIDEITAYVGTVNTPCTLVNGVDFTYDKQIQAGDLIGYSRASNTVRTYYGTSESGWCYKTASLTDFTLTQKTYGFAIYATVATSGDTVLTMEKSEDTNTSAVRQICFVDFTNGTMGFYNKAADGSALTVYQQKDIGIPVVVGHEYVAEMIKLDSKYVTLRITDAYTLESDEITCSAYEVGRGWGARKHTYLENGQLKDTISAKSYTLQNKKTRLLIVGDSYIEGSSLPQYGQDRNNRYAMLMKKALGGDCFINGRGGASSANILGWFNTYLPYVCQPDYTIVSCGGNDSSYDNWLARYQAIIAKIKEMGSKPILTTVSAMAVSASKDIFGQMNDWIRSSGYDYIDINLVTSLDYGMTELDPDYFLEDNAHPNTLGHQVIFNRAKIDVPYLFR